ncbi:hypothetical protein J2W40_003342 [Sphingobium xenophagum]|uniref:Sulfotransferase n=2 Tax=Sphingobium xenophagum TaxID=121428 RepID=A0ABU1X4I1_SPHXE|nr:hypothetical protein [Sphingobium xenophagum]
MQQAGLQTELAPDVRANLDRIVSAFNQDAALNATGEAHVLAMLTDKLLNRLHIDDWHRRHPGIANERIDRPIFGIGLPRTGSTALGVMMGQDPACRVLRTWEARQPCPPPLAEHQTNDPRIAEAQANLDATLAAYPSLGAMIPMAADAATECLLLLSMDFCSKEFEAYGRLNSYDQGLLQMDMEPTYQFHKRALQLLQWRCPPNRWFLRTPAHAAFLPAIDAVYPDARFVMTHRDIAKVIPSNMTLVLSLSQGFSNERDLAAMACHMVDFWEAALRRLIAFREAGNEHRFHDIQFSDFQSDPLEEIRRLYDWLGEPFSETAENRMRSWWTAQAEERQCTGKVDFSELGISLDELEHRFAFYSDRFVR